MDIVLRSMSGKIFFGEMSLVSKTDIETIEKAVQKSGMACVEGFEVY